jgi:hypothetical protein
VRVLRPLPILVFQRLNLVLPQQHLQPQHKTQHKHKQQPKQQRKQPKQQRKQPKLHSKHQKEAPATQVAVAVGAMMAAMEVMLRVMQRPKPEQMTTVLLAADGLAEATVMLEAATYNTVNLTSAWPVVEMCTVLCALLLRFSKMANTAFTPRKCMQMVAFLTPTT